MGRAGSLQRQLPSRTLSLPFKRSGSKLCLRFARQSLRTGVLKARAGQMPHGCPVNSYQVRNSAGLGRNGSLTEVSFHDKMTAPAEKRETGERTEKGFRNGIKYFSIAGLGEQHVAEDQIRWREIPGGTAVQFYILNGKIVEGESNTGRITEVSVDGKYGKMETESGLIPLQELMISLGGEEAYAKVLKREGKYYRIGFTLNPESFSAKLEKR